MSSTGKTVSVTLTAIGAEGIEQVSGSSAFLSFFWSRGKKFFLSEPAEVFPDGAVYWDSISAQTCRLAENEKKYVKLFVQKVTVGADGLPTDYGTTVGAGYIDLGKYATDVCGKHDDTQEDTRDRDASVEEEVVVMLKPSGRLTLNVRLDPVDGDVGDGAISADESTSSQCVTPTYTHESSGVSEEVGEVDEVDEVEGAAKHAESPSMTVSTTSTMSYAENGGSSSRSIESKLRRVTRQCEEARARAFSEASVALQRGIEIDNLKRAKDILMKRLETAEQQLMTMMKQELAMTIQETDKSSATLLGIDALIEQLAETKVALAEKEFEVMEMQGKLKGRDAHVQALLMHLEAVKEASLVTARSSERERVGTASVPLAEEVDEEANEKEDANQKEEEQEEVDDGGDEDAGACEDIAIRQHEVPGKASTGEGAVTIHVTTS